MDTIEKLYEAAARAGLLKLCRWVPSSGGIERVNPVGVKAQDDTVLDHLASTTDITMSYPASIFEGLKTGEIVDIEGVRFQVREINVMGDGSELRARLTRL